MIDKQTVDKIIDATNIVDVVSDFISLRKAGTSYKGLCPFHDDSTPSFSVSPIKGVYKCFSCGAAGNAVKFVMQYEQMTYWEALKWLGKKYNIEVKEREMTSEEKLQASERESMLIVNEWASNYFQNILATNPDGRAIGLQYFRSRGFRDDIIKKFQLGFCLSPRDSFAKAALEAGYKKEFLLKTGLCFERQTGELVDRFNGRVMFPWISVSGKVTAFGGRLLDSRTKGVMQKYVNSPDSEIYHKERELYGIFQAKKAIAKYDLVYMVEGYTDVISMHQCGIENVVANSGTALSVYQIRLLHRFTSNIVLLYDGDAAGQHAALRGTDMLLSEGMNVKVLLLPDGKDPDEFVKMYSAEDLVKYIEDNQTDFIVFKINLLLKGVTDPIKRSEAINSIVESISVIKDPILRDTYLHECMARTGMAEQTLIAQMNRFIYNGREREKREAENQRTRENHLHNADTNLASVENPNNSNESATKNPTINSNSQFSILNSQFSNVETWLIQAIIRYGERVILKNVKDEVSGKLLNLNVAQYIAYDLGLDNLSFTHPLYNQILSEAVEHSTNEDFVAENYFIHHRDLHISEVATALSVDKFQLSESLQLRQDEAYLFENVKHLILDFRLNYVEKRLKELKEQIKQAVSNEGKIKALVELQKMQQLRNILAQKLGNDIII